jgi:hypothetical protein
LAQDGDTILDLKDEVKAAGLGNAANTASIGVRVASLTQNNIPQDVPGSGNVKITTNSAASISGNDKGISTFYSELVPYSSGYKDFDLGASVTGGAYGIHAGSTGTGYIKIKTSSGADISGTDTNGIGIYTTAVNGANTLDIASAVTGGAAGTGILAKSSGTGAININIAAGGTVSGGTYALDIQSKNGNVTVTNAGTVSGSVRGTRESGGTANFTFINNGFVDLGAGESITGFDSVTSGDADVVTGTGNFGNVVMNNGSILRPGDRSLPPVNGVPQVGTMNVSSLDMRAGSKLEIRADASGVSDKVNSTGAAQINGASLYVLASPNAETAWQVSKTYEILTASSVTGTFVVTDNLAFLDPTVT